jgi:hypothetical protein
MSPKRAGDESVIICSTGKTATAAGRSNKKSIMALLKKKNPIIATSFIALPLYQNKKIDGSGHKPPQSKK